ncbi:MAG: glycoside hydrolase family 16 protein [Bacteroidaceae bacterium]|nr:glycoside hydrolase family 16 protein [Bacteroidaceae bacterium]
MLRKTIMAIAVLCATGTKAQDYPVSFPTDQAVTHASRRVSSVSLGGQTIKVADAEKVYNEMTDQTFTVRPGQRVKASMGYNGAWMNAYAYIDFGQDGQFDVSEPNEDGTLGDDNDLVSYSYYNHHNSAGATLADGNTAEMPAFTIPTDMEEGTYRMRFKLDWDCIDPAGSTKTGNELVRNGGVVVDVSLLVSKEGTGDDATWQLVFSDEFNQADGSLPDSEKWTCSTKGSSAWARYITDSPLVAFIEDGCLVTRCIPDPDREEGSTDMISGAIESRGKYTFQYGRVEARLKTIKHSGNFPALWMMPENRTGGWPTCGEIDIFETIDSQDRAWHTVHSNWTYTLGKTNAPQSSANEWLNVEDWHIYALEWDSEELRWYVDDRQVFSYHKSDDSDILGQGQWPFDKAFYLILNQSVGNGSWAAWQDPDFTYETRFDYVRVYQLQPTQFIPTGIEATEQRAMDSKAIYDLSGRMVADGEYQDGKLPKGIYIRNGRKFVVR